MQACHWKAHNTLTNFYLKDLTWSDNNNNMYLGPVVAAQQVLDPSPQTSHPLKEKKGGAHPLQPSLRVRSFFILFIKYICIKDLSRLSLIMRIPTIGLVFHSWMVPKGPYTP